MKQAYTATHLSTLRQLDNTAMPLRHCPRFFQEPNIKAGSPTTSATTDVACTARCNVGDALDAAPHATNRAWRDALAAVAVGEVILCDKEKAGEYKKYNEGHVPDIVQPGASAASAPGAPTGSVRPRCPRRSGPPPPKTSAST